MFLVVIAFPISPRFQQHCQWSCPREPTAWGSSRQPTASRESSDPVRAVFNRGDMNHYATTTTLLSPRQTFMACIQVYHLPHIKNCTFWQGNTHQKLLPFLSLLIVYVTVPWYGTPFPRWTWCCAFTVCLISLSRVLVIFKLIHFVWIYTCK